LLGFFRAYSLGFHPSRRAQLFASLINDHDAAIVFDSRDDRDIVRSQGSSDGWQREHNARRLSLAARFTDHEYGELPSKERRQLIRPSTKGAVLRQANPSASVCVGYPIYVERALRQHLDPLTFIYGCAERVGHDMAAETFVHEKDERLTQPAASHEARPR
jgi:hypothetical protein